LAFPPHIKWFDIETSLIIIFGLKRNINVNISFNFRESKKSDMVGASFFYGWPLVAYIL